MPREAPTPPDATATLVGSSAVMCDLRSQIARIASTDFTVLIEGESGTGKELVARLIHASSRRHRGPFVAVNCAALVETLVEAELFGIEERTATGVRGRRGKFEHAEGGTILLDEISDLSALAQAKLLRAIQDLAVERVGSASARRIDTRIVAATNQTLAGQVDRGLFRADLFYRLSGVDLHVPPLRHRRDDVLQLARYFLYTHRHSRPLTLAAGAADALIAYDWPGNVRELEHCIHRAMIFTKGYPVQKEDIQRALERPVEEAPARQHGSSSNGRIHVGMSLDEVEREFIKMTLASTKGNKKQAANMLGISRRAIYDKLKKYGMM
jgi:DNA-binding NtrC family response regulator